MCAALLLSAPVHRFLYTYNFEHRESAAIVDLDFCVVIVHAGGRAGAACVCASIYMSVYTFYRIYHCLSAKVIIATAAPPSSSTTSVLV